jgi:ABC-type Na+ efflux pump permease subunit
MKFWMTVLTLVLCLGFVNVTHAAKGDKKGLRGKISSVDGKSVVVTSRGKNASGDVTVMTDDNTTVTIDGKKSAVGDLKAGMFVMVSPAEGTAATITATTTRPQKKNAKTSDSKKPADSSNATDSK